MQYFPFDTDYLWSINVYVSPKLFISKLTNIRVYASFNNIQII
jgi:hypothetical protein